MARSGGAKRKGVHAGRGGSSARRDSARWPHPPLRPLSAFWTLLALAFLAWATRTALAERVADAPKGTDADAVGANALSALYPPLSYAGRDADGVPHYTARPFSAAERRLLLDEYGIDHPENLYLSDSTPYAVLLYDTERDCGDPCLVSSYRVGAPSVRRHGESWAAMEERIRHTPLSSFPRSARIPTRSLAALSPVARGAFDTLLTSARAAGYTVRVTESYRSPLRQAYLLRRGMTYTATSLHSDRRAIDVVVGNGRLRDSANRARWTAFRTWVRTFDGGRFRIIGRPDSSWDWPHIELPNRDVGFRSVEALLDSAAVRAARDDHASRSCPNARSSSRSNCAGSVSRRE